MYKWVVTWAMIYYIISTLSHFTWQDQTWALPCMIESAGFIDKALGGDRPFGNDVNHGQYLQITSCHRNWTPRGWLEDNACIQTIHLGTYLLHLVQWHVDIPQHQFQFHPVSIFYERNFLQLSSWMFHNTNSQKLSAWEAHSWIFT